ncbi:hypothetical protein EHS25_008618 [Saitozyma podzolica]|uniref:Nudix hydrolase domain-containing protein n=1 Tax=Saitozyma podzolica TaxID=1890683 RepID=A0A427YM89_9TREE|nr:hypothetical protein EHS25_008618 [Saitozyma podzolica]
MLPRIRITRLSPTRTAARNVHTRSSLPPFTRSSLDAIKSVLVQPPPWSPTKLPDHTVGFSRGKVATEAAVLIPLLNVEGKPHVLMEVRSSTLRTHAGEVSFPGGRMDPTDDSLVHTALRETQEELALASGLVEVLGALDSPEYSLGNRSRVWPIVGFVHSSSDQSQSPGSSSTTLPSFRLDKLLASPDEVAAILPLPLSALLDPSRRRVHHFRIDARRPYYTTRVGDLIARPPDLSAEDCRTLDKLEVWGLSGWFLNRLAWTVGWLDRPPAGPEYED